MGIILGNTEIKAILTTGIEPVPNYETWSRYLISASYDDDDCTFFKGISQLTPGECATWSINTGLKKKKYYSLHDRLNRNSVNIQEASQVTQSLLIESIKLHMRSDVPVGLALSGGLDSTAIVYKMRELTNHRIKTFTTGFSNKDLKRLNQSFRDEFSQETEYKLKDEFEILRGFDKEC